MFDFWISLFKDICIWIRGEPTLHIDEWGIKRWFYCGKSHCEVGPAVEYPDGTKFWHSHGKLHRVGGPAIERTDGAKFWYLKDKLHREDGPAIEYPNGEKRWYLNNRRYSFEDYIMELEKMGLKEVAIDCLFQME